MKTTLAKAAALAAAGCAAALALAGPASAEKYGWHFAQDCPQPFSQNCSPQPGVNVATKGPLFVTFTADGIRPALLARRGFSSTGVSGVAPSSSPARTMAGTTLTPVQVLTRCRCRWTVFWVDAIPAR